ncbi:EF-hand domain-containing protein [Micavibrio aeruginosavorus]|uniref:EF hand family protein n=1 Tax=Micavibrio aeruginosavorus (strain ARL-13) TaxID=856793 RepID=G2KS13_MICAA|nr:EF-hand domain-containing protein [Micavibrio aeruginosavorus]AEP10521.1 EF hand family protein [Micavibrio aeruginosavorus ARL-13]
MTKTLGTLLVVSLLSIPSIAMADDKKEVPEYLQKKYDRRVEDMKKFDKNKDGVLQAEELRESVATKFDAADINKDGVISEQERAASLDKFKSETGGAYGEALSRSQTNRIKNRYNNADKNNDGKISQEEYQAYMEKHQTNFDRDGDGVISKKEYRLDGEKLPSSYVRKLKED